MQLLTYLPAHPMVHISLGYILLDIQCLGHLFHHFMVVPFLNHMLFQLVELCMDQLELFLMSLNLEVEVLGLGVEMQVLQLAVTSLTNKAHSRTLEIWGLHSTFLPLKIQIASHLWVAHYLNLDLSIMYVLFFLFSMYPFLPNSCTFIYLTHVFLSLLYATDATRAKPNISWWIFHGGHVSGFSRAKHIDLLIKLWLWYWLLNFIFHHLLPGILGWWL